MSFFRLRNNLRYLSRLKNKNDKIIILKYNGMKIDFRIMKYSINNKLYYLGITIYDENIEYFKNLYWKR